MNVPNLNFDAERDSARLPSTAAYGSRAVANAPYGEFINFDQGSTFDHRKAIFTYLGLALKYRWLILTFLTVGLAIGFIVTFTSTPIYRATVSIQIDRQAPRIVKTDTQPDFGDGSDRFYQTQYDLLNSRMLAERVASDLNLASASDFLDPPSTSPWRKLRSLILPTANTGTASEDKGNDAGNLEQRKAAAAGMVRGGLSIDP